MRSGLVSINLVVGTDKLGDGLAGRSSPVLQGGDGRRDHLSVGGMVRRLLGRHLGRHVDTLNSQCGMVGRARC